MGFGTTSEHADLAAVVSRFVEKENLLAVAHRALVDGPSAYDGVWKAMAAQGWPALGIPEEYGGAGFALDDMAVVVHGLAAGMVPGPLVPTTAAGLTLSAFASEELKDEWLPQLAEGSITASVALAGVERPPGATRAVAVGADGARLHLVCVGADVHVHIGVEELDGDTAGLDPALGCVVQETACDGLAAHAVLTGAAGYLTAVTRVLAACESAGGAAHTLHVALEHAKTRHQFGRPIGGFQAVKHHLAEMRVRVELAVAAAWGAARLGARGPEGELAAAVAASVAVLAFEANARKAHQILGGMGFTWEHDAHLYLRRATSWSILLDAGGSTGDDVYTAVAAGVVPRWNLNLPEDASVFRDEVSDFVARYDSTPEDDRRSLLVSSGYLVPHWPRPWGRDAGPIEQLVVEELLQPLGVADLDINGWVLLTLVQSATAEQLDRWILPGLLETAPWCQMFSEPEAGSDAAAVRTRAVATDGGWLVSGQKMWTTGADECVWGLATVRTDPSASKHAGITMMALDLRAPGVTIRPIQEITGGSTINEVFIDDVFVPHDDVVGEVGGGWVVARSTLGNERVSIGGRRPLGYQARDLVPILAPYIEGDPHQTRRLGELLARELAMELITVRGVVALLADVEQSDVGSITKVLNSEHQQALTEFGIRAVGVLGVEARLQYEFLFNRCLTIAGGTSEIGRNVIGERLLGLPREPAPLPSPRST